MTSKFHYLKSSLIGKLVKTAVCQYFETALVCTCLCTNRTSLELQSLLSQIYLFFQNWSFQIGRVAYLWVRLIHGLLWYIPYNVFSRQSLKHSMGLHSGGLVIGRNSLLELGGGGIFRSAYIQEGWGRGSLWYLGNQFSPQNELWT